MRQFISRKYSHTPPHGWNFQVSYFQVSYFQARRPPPITSKLLMLRLPKFHRMMYSSFPTSISHNLIDIMT